MKTKHLAFTLLEVILVMTLVAVGVGFSALYSQTAQVRADVNAQAATLSSHLRLAQSSAAAGEGGESHGIHLESDEYVLFDGSPYVSGDPDNVTIELPPTIHIQSIALNGGGNDIIFDPPQGETSTHGSFELYSESIEKTLSITIHSIGIIQY